MSDSKFSTECPVSEDGKHIPISPPIWMDEDDEVMDGMICRVCGEEL